MKLVLQWAYYKGGAFVVVLWGGLTRLILEWPGVYHDYNGGAFHCCSLYSSKGSSSGEHYFGLVAHLQSTPRVGWA